MFTYAYNAKIKKPSLKGWFYPSIEGFVFKKKPHDIVFRFFFVENIGVEPMTFWLPAKRSSQLS
tara:strand:+ start:10267 stop:10458 length:192 start_codon:yes stop_codon:yes gene_type:complete